MLCVEMGFSKKAMYVWSTIFKTIQYQCTILISVNTTENSTHVGSGESINAKQDRITALFAVQHNSEILNTPF